MLEPSPACKTAERSRPGKQGTFPRRGRTNHEKTYSFLCLDREPPHGPLPHLCRVREEQRSFDKNTVNACKLISRELPRRGRPAPWCGTVSTNGESTCSFTDSRPGLLGAVLFGRETRVVRRRHTIHCLKREPRLLPP